MGQVQSSEKHPGERKTVRGLPSKGGAVRGVTLQGPSSPSARDTPPNTNSHLPLPLSFTRSGHAFPHFGVSLGPLARKRRDSRRGSADALNARLASRPHSRYFLISGYRGEVTVWVRIGSRLGPRAAPRQPRPQWSAPPPEGGETWAWPAGERGLRGGGRPTRGRAGEGVSSARGKTQGQKKRKAGRPIANLERKTLSITKIRHTIDACARRTEASLPELPLWLTGCTLES